MPELAEVEFFRKQWDPGIGHVFDRVSVHPKARIFRETPAPTFKKQLAGETLEASHTHGKKWMFQFSNGKWLAGHLGMTGKLFTASSDYKPEKHDHLVLHGKATTLVFCDPRMFGKVTLDFEESGGFPKWWVDLPPSPLDSRFTKTLVFDFMARHPKSPIKTLLLDQRVFPGIGNWMADEICWRLPIDPATRTGELSESERVAIWKLTRQLSKQAMRVIGDEWKKPPNSWLFNHRWKDGGNCPRKDCGSDLTRADLRGRTTCWCPNCQV